MEVFKFDCNYCKVFIIVVIGFTGHILITASFVEMNTLYKDSLYYYYMFSFMT